ncbi:beta-ketoacyl synthase domain-containing protein [Stachybotrys elegans]|uniref:Beta-ketoacyl synthase domain-containing protein n=1 Tax=Stachybotrys elegans TaxID=80388 RepID=A0A8K0WXH0_9HYPO|nr:beta-ketoacyl synthase domain-containing protein [Stachybotrys elegans]
MTSEKQAEPIAIVGTGCRFPGGASSPSALWELLRDPRDVLREIPRSRFDVRGYHHADPQFPGHANVRHSYLLDGNVAHFDAQFFNITAAEAVAMDPQQRLLLETVYEAIEAAGLTIEGLRGSDTGVYAGQMFGDYEALLLRDLQNIPLYHGIGTGRSILSNRISYFFDWHGPSLTVDTACSSSLVALHQAVQALRSGEVRTAVAAGANLLLGPEPYIYESKLKMLSPDGRSRMWDAGANGYARGEGVAAIVLKTLAAAIADGDHIECIVRETGVNQDGRSRGITMPRASAQAALIRETYARAGLDPTKAADRCEYFEAHGTGTPAGDPVEAEAVHTAFFSHGRVPEGEQMYIGSVKTIIGHTESTAGLAGILKVVQAMKHGYVPPNMLLERLNPDVQPFYQHVEIPQTLIPWPPLPAGRWNRRASVNSFGFGGTNAHVILESYDAANLGTTLEMPLFTPFVFSAQSKASLLASLVAHADYLDKHPETHPADLAWMLRARRSRLPLRVTFPASPVAQLRARLRELTSNFQLEPRPAAIRGRGSDKTRLLGVFTGQGAQWARMGAELVERSAQAADVLADLDDALKQLPEPDRPLWTLRDELLAEAAKSRVDRAAIAQPICTAVQVMLVVLLRHAGLRFATVVGHSSGEIAAAFAAGWISARDAIRIAYYRGFHAHHASASGPSGAMLAVGTSFEDASAVCGDDEFRGRVSVAAHNSPSSVTLSGDEDAIAELADLYEDDKKFVRRLRVEHAYHSHHMRPCAQPYLDSMHQFSIEARGETNCIWVSSVDPNCLLEEKTSKLEDASYWVDNLLSPVRFTEAVQMAMSLGPYDAAVEVGPHPALKGPVRETLQTLQIDEIPYTGLLQRNQDAVESMSTALGYLWTNLDGLSIDFDGYERAMGSKAAPYRFVPDLPVYQWNHDREYWHESHLSRSLRQRSQPVHPLLGDLAPQSSSTQLTWKAILRPKDLPWVNDHRIQGQTVFPAAGYAVTALEAAKFLVQEPVQIIEMENLAIHQALVFDDDQETGIEVRCTVSRIVRDHEKITAHFNYEACIGTSQPAFQQVASCHLCIHLGEPSPSLLPAATRIEPNMVDVPTDTVYSTLEETGYGYTGPFRALSGLMRKRGMASGFVTMPEDNSILVHPALLDAAFHSIILAFSYPGDGRLWSLHLPVRINRIRVNPSACQHAERVGFVASIVDEADGSGFDGDVEVHDLTGEHASIQVEGLHVVPLSPATAADDRQLFYTMRWVEAEPNAHLPSMFSATRDESKLALILERGSYFYLRQLDQQVPADHPGRLEKANAAYLSFAAHTHKLAQEGRHRYAKPEWVDDTLEDIITAAAEFADRPEVKAMHVVGQQMARCIRGETTMLEHLMTGLLDDYYARALSMPQATNVLAETVAQITKRHPGARIIEVGAGTGGATRQILARIGNNFSSYDFTDVSTGFFDGAQAEFDAHDRMTYKVLDLDKDIQPQGFEVGTYDVVVASLVLHATKSLEDTARRVRTLLKPGGYLVVNEVTNVDLIRLTALFGCLPGWWQGVDEGRTLGAPVTETKWDAILRSAGFSGIETMSPTSEPLPLPTSVMVSQAVDDWVEFVRQPLAAPPYVKIPHLWIAGGVSLDVSRLAQGVHKCIGSFCGAVSRVESLEDLGHINSDAVVLVLADLDRAVFENMTPARFASLKRLFASEKTLLWITRDRMTNNPFANIVVGFARSALWEVPDLRYQFVDFQTQKIDARAVTEAVLRFVALGSMQERNALWTAESEIVVGLDGRHLIPRMEPVMDANDRYNSARRTITRASDQAVVAIDLNGRYALHELRGADKTMKVTHSTLKAVNTRLGPTFLVLGNTSDGTQCLGTAASTGSSVQPPQAVVAVSIEPGLEALFLKLVAANLVLPLITENLEKGQVLLLHNSPLFLASLVQRSADLVGAKVFYSTTSREAQQQGWIYLAKHARQRQLRALLPTGITRCVDLTHGESSAVASLPYLILDTLSLFPRQAKQISDSELLRAAVDCALADLAHWKHDATACSHINPHHLVGGLDPFSVVKWDDSLSLSITVQPARPRLRPDATYWLVGLSSDMGLSIAEWMLRALYKDVSQSMPPIAGVAQGAMVLDDVAMRDMTLQQLTRVLGPKVDGSINLDRLFHDMPLDFFVFFSSLASVAGNLGQANYTAANMFMSGLASQRRRRGVAASVIDLGPVLGTGIITRELGEDMIKPLLKRGFEAISESDVHQAFAEAILASPPDAASDWHISTDFRPSAYHENRPLWYTYPQFACFTLRQGGQETTKKQTGTSTRDQLALAATKDEIKTIISDAFVLEMRKMVNLSSDYEITTSTRTDELGLDSLVAVRIRSWFLNSFQVNIPALRILKGASLLELVEQALDDLPVELTPVLIQGSASESNETTAAQSIDSVSDPDTPSSSDDLSLQEEKDDAVHEADLERHGPLSNTQSVFLFVHELLKDKTTLNNTGAIHLKGNIRIDDLSRATRLLGDRHEALRTCICTCDGKTVQGILESSSLTLEHKTISTPQQLDDEYNALRSHKFDIARGLTSRLILLSYSPNDHYLLIATHHIIFDRASTNVFLGDLERLYQGHQLGPPLQYLDYSNAEHQRHKQGHWEDAISFWRRQFEVMPDALPLHRSQATQRQPLERYASHTLEFSINNQLSAKIREVARQHRATSFHFHLAAFKVLLQRFLGIHDVCIGIADSCRRDQHTLTGIGPFLNMLPVRLPASGERFGDTLATARSQSLLALSHAMPFEVILNELKVARHATHTPLAQAFLNYAETSADIRELLDCQAEAWREDQAELPYDMAFTIVGSATDTRIILNVQASLYTQEDATMVAHGYQDILEQFVAAPNEPIGEWKFRPAVLQKALAAGRGPQFASSWPETLMHRFNDVFPGFSHRPAVTDEHGNLLTYEQLSQRVNMVALELLRKGIQPGSRVAVFQHPTVDWAASVLAILKVGAVYVALDAGTPAPRLALIVADSQPAALLVHDKTLAEAQGLEMAEKVIDVSNLTASDASIPLLARPGTPAIILYTSGSSGIPKGVVLGHDSLKHEFDHCGAVYGLGEDDVVLQQSAWSFDLSITQIFLALGSGAQLHMVSHFTRSDAAAMAGIVATRGITVTYATPTEYKSWLRQESPHLRASSWKLALVAGEPVTEALLQLFRNISCPHLRLFNIYGPTETTCGSTKMEIAYSTPGYYQGTIPVGQASANECFYILDTKQNLQPLGKAGEIAIGGVGVAMGYLNQERNKSAFVPDPFASDEYKKHGWTTMYRTGDLGHLLHDGTLVLRGRISDDTEVKLNGVRIDLMDVEQTVLRAADGILSDAVATLRSVDEFKYMLVHVVFSSATFSNRTKFLDDLLHSLPLPRTVRPSAIIPIDALPRTVSGKTDRRAIASLIPKGLTVTESPDLFKNEAALCALWKSVIPDDITGLHNIEADSDFFSVGGNSLLLIELQRRIQEEFNVSVPLISLFQTSTLRVMAQLLGSEEIQGSSVNWTTETEYKEMETKGIYETGRPPAKLPRVVVLTGATGFVGQHLLSTLVKQEHIEKVICIAVRDLKKRQLFMDGKVVCYEGDLTLPRLGLSEGAAAEVFGSADAVIHNGADVSHLKTYASLRRANLGSTQELARLCRPRKLPLHYVSTTGVTMYTGFDEWDEVSVRDWPPPTDGQYGYIASKWASEVYLENLHASCGLPVYIHRLSSVVRPSASGHDPMADDVLQNMLSYSKRLCAVPLVPGLRGTADLVQPSTVAAKLTDVLNAGRRPASVVYVHESGDAEIDLGQLREYIAEAGKDIHEVPLEEWVARAEAIGLSTGMATVFRALKSGMVFPKILKSKF